MKKLTNYLLALGMSALPYTIAGVSETSNKNIEKRVLEFKESLKPHWNLEEIKDYKITKLNKKVYINPEECARYARIIGKKEYKKTYAETGSKNRIYYDEVIAKINEKDPIENWKELDTLAMTGELKPGMIVGFYYTRSSYRHTKDEKGKKVIATHNAIYRGPELIHNEKTGKEEVTLVFDHQWGSIIERIKTNSEWINKKKNIIYPTYVVDAKTYQTNASDFARN